MNLGALAGHTAAADRRVEVDSPQAGIPGSMAAALAEVDLVESASHIDQEGIRPYGEGAGHMDRRAGLGGRPKGLYVHRLPELVQKLASERRLG